MTQPIRILIVEDSLPDAELAQREIRKVLPTCKFERADTRGKFLAALETFQPDLIVSDYHLPHFDGMTALKLALERTPLTPLIIWTGSLNEDIAVDCMKAGAANYVLKDNPKRLNPAVLHALQEKQTLLQQQSAEHALHASEERFRTLYENTVVGIYRTTPDGQIIMANPAVLRMLGYNSFEELAQRNLERESFEPNYARQEFREKLERDGIITGLESNWVKRDGNPIYVRENARAIRDEQGNILYYDGTFEDITARKLAEQASRQSEEKYRNLFSKMLNGCAHHEIIYDDHGKLIDYVTLEVNEAFESILQVKGKDVIGKRASELLPPKELRQWIEIFGLVAQTGKSVRYEIYSPLNQKHFEGTAYPLGNGHFAVTFADVTERKHAEEALRESEARYRVRTEELETLVELSTHLRQAPSADDILPIVMREIKRVIKADDYEIILLDSAGEKLTVALSDGVNAAERGFIFPSNVGLSGQVIKTRQPYLTECYSTDPHQLVGLKNAANLGPAALVPLQSDQEIIGVLMISRFQNAQPFSTDETRLLVAIGEMAGNALRRARLIDAIQIHLRRTQGLHDIQLAVAGSFDLQMTLDVALENTLAQLQVDAADVLLFDPHTLALDHAASRGFKTRQIENSHLRVGDDLIGRIITERRLLHIPDMSNIPSKFSRSALIQREEFVAYYGMPLIAKGQIKGVLEIFHRAPLVIESDWLSFMETLAGQIAIAIDNLTLFTDLQQSNFKLAAAYDATIEGLGYALDLRDKSTKGHTQRVVELVVRLARAMDIKETDLLHIRRGALLHDIGKIGIPDALLLKPSALNDDEWAIMQRHPQYAFEMISNIEYLRPALDIPYSHHEKWDGTGYPRGLKGEEIPLAARLFSIVDVWDALTSERPYRPAWTRERAIAYIREQAGKHFEPRVVQAFLDLLAQNDYQTPLA